MSPTLSWRTALLKPFYKEELQAGRFSARKKAAWQRLREAARKG
jgi:hypothetical protein